MTAVRVLAIARVSFGLENVVWTDALRFVYEYLPKSGFFSSTGGLSVRCRPFQRFILCSSLELDLQVL